LKATAQQLKNALHAVLFPSAGGPYGLAKVRLDPSTGRLVVTKWASAPGRLVLECLKSIKVSTYFIPGVNASKQKVQAALRNEEA
jgi:hypothetical protein